MHFFFSFACYSCDIYLYGFFELQAEILENFKALIQFEGVFVFTEEVNEGITLFAQVQPAKFKVLQGLCRALTNKKNAGESFLLMLKKLIKTL